MTPAPASHRFEAIAAATGEPVKLAMQELCLGGNLLPAGARLAVRHKFCSAETEPLEVVYCFALPRDAALRSFEIHGPNYHAHSDLKPVQEAVQRYEQGLEQGHMATLARQYGDGLINLSVGNLKPGEEVTVTLEIIAGVDLTDDGFRFRFPFTLAPSYHSQALAYESEPGAAEIELPAAQFGDLMLPQFRASAKGLHRCFFDLSVRMPGEIEEISSPSHAIRVRRVGSGESAISLAPAADVPDRDLVLDIKRQIVEPLVLAGAGESGTRHFAALIPSPAFGEPKPQPRSVAFLIDRSGSMEGEPIIQARKAVAACLAALEPGDSFGIVAFASESEAFHDKLVKATPDNRRAAARYLETIDAHGSTELTAGVQAAAKLLSATAGDIFVLTDGQVFGVEPIIASARATGIRLHTLGIGSASQDRFLTLLARETGGISRFVTARERVDLAAVDLFASASAPIATGLKVSGPRIEPAPADAVFPGRPLLLYGEVTAPAIELEWNGGSRSITIPSVDNSTGETLRLLRGSRLITDAEARVLPDSSKPENRKTAERMDKYLERLSKDYGLASRRMALVAVVEREGDRPGAPPSTRVVPVKQPQDTSFAEIFAAPPSFSQLALAPAAMPMLPPPPPSPQAAGAPSDFTRMFKAVPVTSSSTAGSAVGGVFNAIGSIAGKLLSKEKAAETKQTNQQAETAVDLVSRLEGDGGMPGANQEERVLTTLTALLALLTDGHTLTTGALRIHVKRMIAWLESGATKALPADRRKVAEKALARIKAGQPAAGDWLKPKPTWNRIEKAL